MMNIQSFFKKTKHNISLNLLVNLSKKNKELKKGRKVSLIGRNPGFITFLSRHSKVSMYIRGLRSTKVTQSAVQY
ncbi:hypothetical protein QL285_000458 [Trifolium repens]|nr:hypothetical protein QL285_000458 [Trifolium repens]